MGGAKSRSGALGGTVWKKPQWLKPVPLPSALVEDLLRSGGTAQHVVSGAWASWGPWSSCSRDCELGFHVRKRTCTNPEPRNGGLPCVGDATEYQDCNPQACPGNPVPSNPGEPPPPREPPARRLPATAHAQGISSPCCLCEGPRAIVLSKDSAATPTEQSFPHLAVPFLLKWVRQMRSLFWVGFP